MNIEQQNKIAEKFSDIKYYDGFILIDHIIKNNYDIDIIK